MNKVAKNMLDKLGTLAHGLEAIEGIAKTTLGDKSKDAFEALHVISVIIDTLRNGLHNNTVTAASVDAGITFLQQALLDNDTAADQALHDKFDKSDKT